MVKLEMLVSPFSEFTGARIPIPARRILRVGGDCRPVSVCCSPYIESVRTFLRPITVTVNLAISLQALKDGSNFAHKGIPESNRRARVMTRHDHPASPQLIVLDPSQGFDLNF